MPPAVLRAEVYTDLALIELTLRGADGPVPARELSEAQGIPLRFLEQQLAQLHKAGKP